jgi:uncharacterized coiled-coil protein SlyX
MSKRYGRNQKRRARERIAALEEAHTMDRALLADVSKRAADLDAEMREWDEEIRRLLGHYSALRRHTPQMQSSYPIREMPIHEPISRMSRFDGEISMSEMTMSVRERMRRFVFTIRRDDMRMQRLIRFMEIDGRGGVSYAISERAIANGFGKREISYLAHEIASNMAHHWNNHPVREKV